MYKLKLIKNDFSSMFHLVHGIKQVCGINSALATQKATNLIKKGEIVIITEKIEHLLNFQKQFSDRGITAII